MARYNNRRRSPSGGGSRWMTVRYAGTCKVCGHVVAAGANAYWDQGTRQLTCSRLACADADGLTRQEWNGSPVSGGFVTVLSPTRIGEPVAARSHSVVLNSGAVLRVNVNGRCEDAGCCDCCTP